MSRFAAEACGNGQLVRYGNKNVVARLVALAVKDKFKAFKGAETASLPPLFRICRNCFQNIQSYFHLDIILCMGSEFPDFRGCPLFCIRGSFRYHTHIIQQIFQNARKTAFSNAVHPADNSVCFQDRSSLQDHYPLTEISSDIVPSILKLWG